MYRSVVAATDFLEHVFGVEMCAYIVKGEPFGQIVEQLKGARKRHMEMCEFECFEFFFRGVVGILDVVSGLVVEVCELVDNDIDHRLHLARDAWVECDDADVECTTIMLVWIACAQHPQIWVRHEML